MAQLPGLVKAVRCTRPMRSLCVDLHVFTQSSSSRGPTFQLPAPGHVLTHCSISCPGSGLSCWAGAGQQLGWTRGDDSQWLQLKGVAEKYETPIDGFSAKWRGMRSEWVCANVFDIWAGGQQRVVFLCPRPQALCMRLLTHLKETSKRVHLWRLTPALGTCCNKT